MSIDLTAGIVRILTSEGETAGTGFVVTDDGLIATCAHVVRAAGAGQGDIVRVAFHATGEELEARVKPEWWRDPGAEDVAILHLEGSLPEGAKPLTLGSSTGSEGHTLTTFGFPDAKPMEGMAGKCEVVGETTERGFPVLQLRSSEVTAGFSGAPVWDEKLYVVVGMVTSITAPDQYARQKETAFIIPVEMLRRVCPALRLPEGCPYRGLQVFEAEHADLYFGREQATRELLDALSRRDIVVLVGVSGSGKSSLVRAGLEKGLREWPVPGLTERSRCLAIPGRNPLLNVVLALTEMDSLTAADVAKAFGLPDGALTDEKRHQAAETLDERSPQMLADAVRACAPLGGLLLVVDQFERLYTECGDDTVRGHFIDTLLAAAGDRVKVLLALRADFYGLALEHPGLERVVKQGGQVTLGRMTEAGLRGAMEKPARAARRSLQPGLAERLISDVRGRAGDLPLLEFALTELWERDNQKGVLTLASYEALGYKAPDGRCFPGVQGAIACRAETVWQELDDPERRAARRIFLNLVIPGPTDEHGERLAEDASRRAWQAEWDETTRWAVQKLVDVRLLTTGQDPVSNQPTVEVAHEALIRAWPRLQQWLADYRPFTRWYDAELAPFLHRWLDKAQHPDFLLPESMLTQSQHWMERYPEGLSGPPEAYIQASVEKHNKERAAQERRRRQFTLAAVGAAAVFLVLALLAWRQRRMAVDEAHTRATAQVEAVHAQATAVAEAEVRVTAQAQAEERRREAESAQATAVVEAQIRATAQAIAEEQRQIAIARQLAVQAQLVTVNTGANLARSVLLAVESLRRYPTLEGNQVLRRGLALPLHRALAQMEHGGLVEAVALSPDGRWVASYAGYTVRVWGAATGREVARMKHEREVHAMAFSPDGQWVASGGGATVLVWDAATGQEVARMEHGDWVLDVDFSPDGQRVASGSEDGTARVWDVVIGEEVGRVEHGGPVEAVAFSPDGQWVASGSWDSTILVWEAATGKEVARGEHGGLVKSVAFSPDGQWVASGGRCSPREHCPTTILVWETATGREVARMEHEDEVEGMAFSPDGRWLASGSGHTVIVWEAATGQEVARMDHPSGDWVLDVVFSPDGRRVASGSGRPYGRGKVRVWEAATGQELAQMEHENDVPAVAFSPDGRWLVSGSYDGTVRVWDVGTRRDVVQVEHKDGVHNVAFSPDGRCVTSYADRTVRVWEAATGREVARMEHQGLVLTVAFSPDGRLVASGGYDGTARVWDAGTGREVARMKHEDDVWAVAFSPDGQWVASESEEWTGTFFGPGEVRVWEAATGREVTRVEHADGVGTVAFSPDGQWVVSRRGGGTVHVWEAATGQEVSRMEHGDDVRAVAFSPSGQWVVSGNQGGTVQMWEAATGQEVSRMEQEDVVVGVAFSPNEQWLASWGGSTVRVWETITGREVARMEHEGATIDVTFSPDGRWVVSGSTDGTARVWETATGRGVAQTEHVGGVQTVAFSPDGQWVASGGWDNTARVWLWRPEDLIAEACSRLPRNLTLEEWQMYLPDEPYRPTCPNLPVPEE